MYPLLQTKNNTVSELTDPFCLTQAKETAKKFLEYVQMVFLLLSLPSPSQRNVQQLDAIRKDFALFLFRNIKGFHLSHYAHKILSHSVEVNPILSVDDEL